MCRMWASGCFGCGAKRSGTAKSDWCRLTSLQIVLIHRSKRDAADAAQEAQSALVAPIRVRMGIHTGEPVVTEEGYVGADAWRAVAVAEPGYYESWEQANAGTGGGMLLEDAIKLYRPGP